MKYLLIILCLWLPIQALALENDVPLEDPIQEARSRAIFKELRCVVCKSESINDSNAMLAGDLRKLVRKRVESGDSNQEVIDYIVSRYGDYVLLSPPVKENTYALWIAPIAFLLIGGIAVILYIRKEVDH